jgi:hypothetical protein
MLVRISLYHFKAVALFKRDGKDASQQLKINCYPNPSCEESEFLLLPPEVLDFKQLN